MGRIPLIIGHRGSSRAAPENTLAAFRLALEEGADGIEADFRLTRDGHIVCMHDTHTRRTADRDFSVADSILNELRHLDVGVWKRARWRGERIPTLTEVLDLFLPGKRLFLEIKSGSEIIPALARELAGRVAVQDVTLLSFNAPLLAAFKERMPEVAVCWLTDYRKARRSGAARPTHADILNVLADIGAECLASQAHETLDAGFLSALRNAGFAVHVWTVDTLAKARYYAALGVDSIMTNRPGWLKNKLVDHHEPS